MLASELPIWLVRATAFLFGSLWGSFFNVAIYRWPRDMSVVTPPSHCPSCGVPVPPYRNVPILGYVFMRGKAPCCGAKLTPRYVVVEVLGAVLCTAVAERFIVGANPDVELVPALLEAFCWFAFTGGLLIATFTDLEDMTIPDEVSLPGAALGLISVELRSSPGAVDAAIGAGIGYLVVQMLFVWGYERAFGRRGMGEGDAKLLLMIGAFLGYQGVLFTVLAASIQGLVAYVIARIAGVKIGARIEHPADEAEHEEGGTIEEDGEEEEDDLPRGPHVPYGPFLALAALEFLFYGEQMLDWYFGLMGV
jgi:leader peptidase (prepilin peptidase) / N-methyltransferase